MIDWMSISSLYGRLIVTFTAQYCKQMAFQRALHHGPPALLHPGTGLAVTQRGASPLTSLAFAHIDAPTPDFGLSFASCPPDSSQPSGFSSAPSQHPTGCRALQGQILKDPAPTCSSHQYPSPTSKSNFQEEAAGD